MGRPEGQSRATEEEILQRQYSFKYLRFPLWHLNHVIGSFCRGGCRRWDSFARREVLKRNEHLFLHIELQKNLKYFHIFALIMNLQSFALQQ